MENFKNLKNEIRSKDEQKQIEDAMVEKMEKWKYEPSELKGHAPKNILNVVSHHWNNVAKIEKDIEEKTLRKLMPNLYDKEIMEAMSNHEDRHTLR